MSRARNPITFLLSALLALMVQIAVGAAVPQPDPAAAVFSAETLCHADQPADGSDHKAPPLDCLVCPFCLVVHAQAVAPPEAPVLRLPHMKAVRVVLPEMGVSPPPAMARPPGQPRAPPLV